MWITEGLAAAVARAVVGAIGAAGLPASAEIGPTAPLIRELDQLSLSCTYGTICNRFFISCAQPLDAPIYKDVSYGCSSLGITPPRSGKGAGSPFRVPAGPAPRGDP